MTLRRWSVQVGKQLSTNERVSNVIVLPRWTPHIGSKSIDDEAFTLWPLMTPDAAFPLVVFDLVRWSEDSFA
ncbi:MAG: hypothetical protein H0V70_07275 [Ktedonobacteraceae bacterium]|nr:hypothetical protein [Ktedonobacteraceae bacterium]